MRRKWKHILAYDPVIGRRVVHVVVNDVAVSLVTRRKKVVKGDEERED